MAVAAVDARHEMGKTLAEVVGRHSAVRELWASHDGDGLHFWLVTEPIDAEGERRLYELADALDERFPESEFELHVLNERHHTGGARAAVPAGADEIPLRVA